MEQKSGKYIQTISGHEFTVGFDVDGTHPQMKVSLSIGSTYPSHWIADLVPDGENNWEGDIWYRKDGAETLKVNSEGRISNTGSIPDRIRVWYGDYNAPGDFYYIYVYLKKSGTNEHWKYWYKKESDSFREMNVEMDFEAGVTLIDSINPHDVDNHRPPSLPNETISVNSTFAKAGLNITNTAGAAVATSEAGSNSKWSNAELHDAMQTAWSKSEAAQWAMWVFQANKHEDDHTGIMFDDIGNHQRCGTAIFHGYSGYSGASAGVVNRHKFHTLVHEMAHSMNLAHSWVKTSGTSTWHSSVVNESEARSYMNYASRVSAGYYGFFDTFEYRFSDQELVFLRHAPEAFVQPGGSAWNTDHAGSFIEHPHESCHDEPALQPLQLTVRCNKNKPSYEYLEFVNLELELSNVSSSDQAVPKGVLEDLAHMNIWVTRNNGPAKVFKPYATFCEKEEPLVTLKPNESLYDSLFLSAGKFGWTVSEPGVYKVVVSINSRVNENSLHVTSKPYYFQVEEPCKLNRQTRKTQEKLAQDIFSDDVGRILAFGGSKVLAAGNNVLKDLTERLPKSKAAKHASVTLAMPNVRDGYKVLTIDKHGNKSVNSQKACEKEGIESIKTLLCEHSSDIAETIGDISFEQVSLKAAKELKEQGDIQGEQQLKDNATEVLTRRGGNSKGLGCRNERQ